SKDQPDESEFSLTAFGLPEPEGVAWEKRTPSYVWALTATGVFAALAAVFRVLMVRRARTSGAARHS
ncbi:hypothetical protein R5W24_004655, partial [Gemmata sp. JC717]|uniref:hypothetical protein n=1 Tax=Gemmata algarum TaxID=2975278 RepID=UPI0021BB3791